MQDVVPNSSISRGYFTGQLRRWKNMRYIVFHCNITQRFYHYSNLHVFHELTGGSSLLFPGDLVILLERFTLQF